MIELLASDPSVIPLWGVALLAVGMYPFGLMLGASCSPCCGCGVCLEGKLPDTVTVALSGYVDETVPGPYLTWLTFDSCIGSGAEGRITAPGITPGPITAVEVTNGGSGYAVVGRVEPTLTISGSGSGADLAAVLTQGLDDACNLIPHWGISSVTVNDGGSGYANGEQLTVAIVEGDTQVTAAQLTANTTITAPTITASVSGSGSGASLTATVTEDPYNPGNWYVSAVTIVDGGTGYTDYDVIVFTADTSGGDVVVSAADGYVFVDGNGTITTAGIGMPGAYYNDDGVIASVTVDEAGEYYREDTSVPAIVPPITVTINESAWTPSNGVGGVLNAVVDDDPDSPTFGQITSITITNAGDDYLAYEEVVEECCQDHYNGRTVVLQNGRDSESIYNGFPQTPQAKARARCRFVHKWCGTAYQGGSPINASIPAPAVPYVMIDYLGPNEYPLVYVNDFGGCEKLLTSTTLIENCDEFSFTATDEDGTTAVVSAGGEYDEEYLAEDSLCGTRCHPCCRGLGEPPCEIEVDVYPDNDAPTTVVMGRDPYSILGWAINLTPSGPRITVSIQECDHPPEVQPNCNNCWKQCETAVSAAYFHPTLPPSCTLTFTSDKCANCADTVSSGLCAPQAGVYQCDNIFNPSGNCADGHFKWTVVVT